MKLNKCFSNTKNRLPSFSNSTLPLITKRTSSRSKMNGSPMPLALKNSFSSENSRISLLNLFKLTIWFIFSKGSLESKKIILKTRSKAELGCWILSHSKKLLSGFLLSLKKSLELEIRIYSEKNYWKTNKKMSWKNN